jgi:hypothetical protein
MKLTLIKGHPETRVKAVDHLDSVHLKRASKLWPDDDPLFLEIHAASHRMAPTTEEVRRGCLTTRILAWEEP